MRLEHKKHHGVAQEERRKARLQRSLRNISSYLPSTFCAPGTELRVLHLSRNFVLTTLSMTPSDSPLLTISLLGLREVGSPAQGHTAGKWGS